MPVKTKLKAKPGKHTLPAWAMYASIALLVVLALAIYFISHYFEEKEPALASSNHSPTPTQGLPAAIDVKQAYGLYGLQSVHFLDVRSSTDFKAYHIASSISVPLDDLSSKLSDVPKDGTVLIVDHFGTEDLAGEAREILLNAGFTSVTFIQGGIDAWVQAGYPFVGVAPY